MSRHYLNFLSQFFHQDMYILEPDLFSPAWVSRFAWGFAERPDQIELIVREIDEVLALNASADALNMIWFRSVPSTYTFHGRSLFLVLAMMRGAFEAVQPHAQSR